MTVPTSEPIQLLAGKKRSGEPVREEVPAERIGDGRFRLAGSPGLAQGAAAGDVIDLREDGTFEVVERGGNLAVQVLADEFEPAALADLEIALRAVGGWLDGGHTRLRVFTVPVAAGFPAVEQALERFLAANADAEWYFGNVYDPVDGVTPLGWWD